MIPVYIGYDRRESVAWHVLADGLIRRSSWPLAITALGNSTLPPDVWRRTPLPNESTEFSVARFLVPHLANYAGWAVFMDCDMICSADIAELWAQRDSRYAVMVVKHDHLPATETKFLGAQQASYPRKNWSSLMLLNCGHQATRRLSLEYVHEATGAALHRFAWVDDAEIGELRGPWNILVDGERLVHPQVEALRADDDLDRGNLVHFTAGGPWFGVQNRPALDRCWWLELAAMLGNERNPAVTTIGLTESDDGSNGIHVAYGNPEGGGHHGEEKGQGRQGQKVLN